MQVNISTKCTPFLSNYMIALYIRTFKKLFSKEVNIKNNHWISLLFVPNFRSFDVTLVPYMSLLNQLKCQ